MLRTTSDLSLDTNYRLYSPQRLSKTVKNLMFHFEVKNRDFVASDDRRRRVPNVTFSHFRLSGDAVRHRTREIHKTAHM